MAREIPKEPRRPRWGLTTIPRTGSAIRNLRRELKWTQADLADQSGVARPQISDIEKGKTDARLSTLLKIFKALDSNLSAIPVDRTQFNLDDHLAQYGHPIPSAGEEAQDASSA